MAWDPDITREQAVNDAAAYLTSNTQDQRTVAEAIVRIRDGLIVLAMIDDYAQSAKGTGETQQN